MLHTLAQVETLFTTPALAALGAAAVTVPVAIHLLSRLRRKRQPWGAMRFLLAAIQAHKRRLRFEQFILLLLRCLIVLLLGLALAGPVITGIPAQRGRVVHILLDDSLASRAATDGVTRFDQLKDTAARLIDGLSANDRVQVWRAGRPAQPLTPEPTLNHNATRSAIEALQPRYSRSDLPAALDAVTQSLETEDSLRDESIVVLLSDFSASVAAPGSGAGLAEETVLRRLDRRAQLLTLRPTAGRANVQIARLEPRRALVVTENAERATVPVALELLRFGDLTLPAGAQATVDLIDPAHPDAPIAQAERRINWPAGQRHAAVNLDLPADVVSADRSLVLRARLDASPELDALREDDTAYAVVSVRKQLQVAVIAEPDDPGSKLTPTKWLTLALTPIESGPIALQMVQPMSAAQRFELPGAGVDAAMVLRPQRLSEPVWRELAALVRRGGLVWVFPESGDEPASWAGIVQRVFDLDDWSITWDPATNDDGWNAIAASTPAPLRLLGADYESLLRPVRVWRRLPIEAPAGETWIAVEGTSDALIASKRVGLGQIVFSAATLDVDWTNLPAKPIFVPLLHESLRGVLGAQRGRTTQTVAGAQPALGPDFAEASKLVPVMGDAQPIEVTRDQDSARPSQALQLPGVFAAESDAALKLAVNVDAAAGDLSAVDEQRLAQWLTPMSGWQWLDPSSAATALVRAVNVARLGWPLLWAVLVLIVLETALARWLSHAGASPADSLSRRLIARLASLRHEQTERKKAA